LDFTQNFTRYLYVVEEPAVETPVQTVTPTHPASLKPSSTPAPSSSGGSSSGNVDNDGSNAGDLNNNGISDDFEDVMVPDDGSGGTSTSQPNPFGSN
jgi:hypothetical protein